MQSSASERLSFPPQAERCRQYFHPPMKREQQQYPEMTQTSIRQSRRSGKILSDRYLYVRPPFRSMSCFLRPETITPFLLTYNGVSRRILTTDCLSGKSEASTAAASPSQSTPREISLYRSSEMPSLGIR